MIKAVTHLKIVFVRPAPESYTPAPVMTKRNLVQCVAGAILVLVTAGCGGINASKSVSPLDFILPGLIQNQPVQPILPPTNSVSVVAQVR